MISAEQRTEIRRLFYAEHWRVGTIVAALGVHRDTVCTAIETERFMAHLARPRRRPLSCFVMVLSWSRAIDALFTLDQTLESFLRGHLHAFAYFAGVARTILYDNLKSAVLERRGEAIRFHPRPLGLCGHYHCA